MRHYALYDLSQQIPLVYGHDLTFHIQEPTMYSLILFPNEEYSKPKDVKQDHTVCFQDLCPFVQMQKINGPKEACDRSAVKYLAIQLSTQLDFFNFFL